MRSIVIPSAAMLVAGLTACSQAPAAVGGEPAWKPDSVLVAIVNQNFYDADIFAEYEGHTSRRIGTVTGFTADTFVIPWRSARLRMRSRLIGARQVISNDLIVSPGDLLELTILPNAHRRRGP